MSIMDFAKDIGRQLFDRDDVAAENIKENLKITGPAVKDLDVQFDDGVVTLCGECASEADRANTILLAGNIQGVEKVNADKLTAPDEPEVEVYEIKSGDTLGKIAKHFYGQAGKYTKIFEANRNIIDDPDKIYPGQKIVIPKD